jgi:hypothetical protein
MVNIYDVVNRQQLDEVRLKKTKLIYNARTEMRAVDGSEATKGAKTLCRMRGRDLVKNVNATIVRIVRYL